MDELAISNFPPESRKMFTVACIPAYNEERTIAKVIIGCQSCVDKVIVYDDGSDDMTATIAEKLNANVIRQETNKGKGEGLRALFRAARKAGADIMITIDGDDQHHPKDIPALIEPIMRKRADVVIGSRFLADTNHVPEHRRIVNKLLNVITLDGISDTQSGFRAYSAKAIESLRPAERGMGVDSEILMDARDEGLVIAEIPVGVMYGVGKTSKLNPARHTLDVVFSILKLISIRHPLLFYGIPGLALVLLAGYYFYHTIALFSANPTITTLTLTYGLLAFAIAMFGLLALFTGIILFTISTVVRKGG